MNQALWQQLVPQLQDLFLSQLAQRLNPWPEDALTVEDVYAYLRQGALRFDRRSHVVVGAFIGRSTPGYSALANLAEDLNRQFQRTPEAIMVPLTATQVEAAQAALDDDQLMVWRSSNYGEARATFGGIGARWGAAPSIYDVARDVSRALGCLLDQWPQDEREQLQSLEAVAVMLEWCRLHEDDYGE